MTFNRAHPARWLLAGVAAWSLVCALPRSHCRAADAAEEQVKEPAVFYDQEPYDLLILNDAKHTEIRIIPLVLTDGKPPKATNPNEKLRIRRFDDPDEEYEVQWKNIAELKLFDQLVLERTRQKVAEGKFNEAFEYFAFLRREYPKAAGINEAFADFLYEEAKDWQRKRNYENALVLLHSLYDRQPQRAGLEVATAAATGKIIEKYVAAGDYAAVRRMVRDIRQRFPAGRSAPRFEQQMNERGMKIVAEGRLRLDAGDPPQALALARRALAEYPKTDGGAQLAQDAFTAFPHVVVGVTAPYVPALNEAITEWSVRRTRRIVVRQLFEFTNYGANGGEYICPLGRWEITDLARGLTLQLKPDIRWQHEDFLSGYDIARRLISLASADRPEYSPAWSAVCQNVSVRGVDTVDVQFRVPQLAPAALLTINPAAGDGASVPPSIAPYVAEEPVAEQRTFRWQPAYFARAETQPQGIIEKQFPTRTAAAAALRLAEVTVVDRLPPWEVSRLRSAPGVTLGTYCVPTVHCLLPNLDRPFMRQRGFRRALVYGIDRQKILAEQILHRQPLAGCEVVSGPFPKGAGLSDPAGYAYDDEIEPRPYEPRLALTLAAVALRDVATAAADSPDRPREIPKLTLAHPADDVARIACQEIVKNLAAINIPVVLREIPLGAPTVMDVGDDLLYLEFAIHEPLVEARRLFGDGGLIGHPSTYMNLTLRQVELATGWNEARQALHDLHRLSHDEVSVVPLWQMTEHFGFHRSLTGVAAQPASLYQAVEQWQATVPLPAEEP